MTRRRQMIGCVIAMAAVSLAAVPGAGGRAQTLTTTNTGVLMGVIVDARTGQPVANAQVTLGGAPPTVNNTKILTDGDGRFVFLDLPRGSYTITATKGGYADGAYGRRRPGGLTQTVALADGERLGDLKISIWKHAAITGTVRDEAGETMVAVPVQVLQPTFSAGKLKLIPGAITRTDDRGMYRLGSLAPGEYVVVVPSTQTTAPQSLVDFIREFRGSSSGQAAMDLYRDLSFSYESLNLLGRSGGPGVMNVDGLAFQSSAGRMRAGVAPTPSGDGRFYVYPTQYFPAAMTAGQATTITVASGEERLGVDMQLKLAATSRISGTVTGPSGPLLATMTLSPDAGEPSTDTGLETATTLSDEAGRFTFLGVPPGQYRLRATRVSVPPISGMSRGAPPPPPPAGTKRPPPPVLPGYTLSATQSIAVDTTDIDGVKVTMHAGFRVSGRAEFPNAATPPDPEDVRRMSATFDPADARPLVSSTIGRGWFDENGQLSSYQLPPGRYYLRINNAPPGWTLKSAIWNGRDISNVAFELDRDVSAVRITFTGRPSTLAVQVQNASSAADATATVLLFPADPASWTDYGAFPHRLRAVRVDQDGRCTVFGLPAGKYLIAAVAEEASLNWQNPRTLQALSRLAIAIALADGESTQVALKTMTALPR